MTTPSDTASEPLPIAARGEVSIEVRPPGSKSQTNRALVCAALARGTSVVRAPLVSDDSRAMRDCLGALGVEIVDRQGDWVVRGTAGDFADGPLLQLDAGASGTTARFITAVAALAERPVTIDGTARMRERPIGPLVTALASLGVDVEDRNGFPPVTVRGRIVRGGDVRLDASTSSQFLSALLLAAPLAPEPLVVHATGLTSAGYVTSTLEVMDRFAASVAVDNRIYRIPLSGYRATEIHIEADASAAVYPWAAAAATGGTATVVGIPAESTQPDLAFLDVLAEMGCEVDGHTIRGRRPLRPIELDLAHMPDGAMTVAVLCAVAEGTSRLHGLATLRVKETDRLGAIAAELGKVGVPVTMERDSLVIQGGGTLTGAEIATYDDHRMAMAFAVLGLAVDGISIADPDCVTKTWPGYFEELATW